MDSSDSLLGNRKGERWLSPPELRRRIGIAAVALLLLSALVLAFGGLVAPARLGKSEADTPLLCREPVWDVGTVSQVKPQHLSHAYRLENRTDSPVRILDVKSSCGCVVADNYPREIGPRGAAELPVKAEVAGIPGPFHKHVVVIVATSPPTKLTLDVRATIASSPALWFLPLAADFGTVRPGEVRTRTLRIERYDGSPVKLVRAVPQTDCIKVQAVTQGDAAGSIVDLKLALDGSSLKEGNLDSWVVVETEHKGYPAVNIPVLARLGADPPGLVGSVFVDRLPPGGYRDELCWPELAGSRRLAFWRCVMRDTGPLPPRCGRTRRLRTQRPRSFGSHGLRCLAVIVLFMATWP